MDYIVMDYIVDFRAHSWQAGNYSQQQSETGSTRQFADERKAELPDIAGRTGDISEHLPLPFPDGSWSEIVIPEPPPPDAPIADWRPAIRADIRANSGLSTESAKRVASGTKRLAVCLATHGITTWHLIRLGPILEFASEPIRDRHGNIVRDRDPDEIRSEHWRARHILKSAARLGAHVPLLDADIRDFLCPPPKPERNPDDREHIEAVVASWRPQRWRHGNLHNLDEVLPDVRKRVLKAGPVDVHQARLWMRSLAGFTLWAVNDRNSDPVAMHIPNNVDTWAVSVNAAENDDWKARTRRALRRLGPAVNPAAWPRPAKPLPRRDVAAPYDTTAEQQFSRAAMLPRRNRRSRLWVLIAAAGAGLSGPEIASAEYNDLIERPDGRWEIFVSGDLPRRVPIRRDYLPLVAQLVAPEDRSRFVASEKSGAAGQIAERIEVGDEHLSLTRARNTFLAAHLGAGTPLAALWVVAGGVAYSTLDRLLPYVAERLEPDAAVEQALGP